MLDVVSRPVEVDELALNLVKAINMDRHDMDLVVVDAELRDDMRLALFPLRCPRGHMRRETIEHALALADVDYLGLMHEDINPAPQDLADVHKPFNIHQDRPYSAIH